MANAGKQVKVHYVGTLDNGKVFDSSRDRGEPLAFVCMKGQMIKGFDAAVNEMSVGEVRDVRIPPQEAYGVRRIDLVQTGPIVALPGAEKLKVGDRVMLRAKNGMPLQAKVTSIKNGNITFDMNHELAGQTLNFNIELLEVE